MTERPPKHRAVMDLGRDEWLDALGMDAADIPKAVIMEGSWWRAQRTEWRLSYLDDVRELAFPDMFYGFWQGTPIVYSCVYGAPRAVELAHLFGVLGTPRMVMIGTCGALDPGLATGDVVVPSQAVAREGVAHLYKTIDEGTGIVLSDPDLTAMGRSALENRGIRTADSLHLTWSSIFAQSGAMVEEWRESGYGSVDMEAATLFAVAKHFGFAATALLVVWDQLTADRSFLDPLTAEEQTCLDAANTAVFETALDIVAQVHRDSPQHQLEFRADAAAKRSPSDLLNELADKGYSWTSVTRVVGVSIPAIRKWRNGSSLSGDNRRRLAQLVALVNVLEEDYLIQDSASWLDMPLAQSSFTGIDVLAAGRAHELMQYAAEHVSSKDLLDSTIPDWRETLDDRFEVYEAPDGEPAIRVRSRDEVG
ncbi:MAG: hypothetical protein OXI33_14795 [Chloroflexota bacterium]|nr:hypothetical protein [Chloroflexota bacterium]